jgi:hypothetical protein
MLYDKHTYLQLVRIFIDKAWVYLKELCFCSTIVLAAKGVAATQMAKSEAEALLLLSSFEEKMKFHFPFVP